MALPTAPFTIYNASAGAGKTYNLVLSYLRICLKEPKPDVYRSILAITFTNKAAGEMKERILHALKQFAEVLPPKKAKPNTMHLQLAEELQVNPKVLGYRASDLLKAILHSYSAFSVSTIDKFTNRLIRSFAQDLNLSGNYEVALDGDALLKEAVDAMLGELKEDDKASKALVNFIKHQLSEGKSPRIEKSLIDMGKNLLNESAQPFLALLGELDLTDILNARSSLIQRQKQIENSLQDQAQALKAFILEAGLLLDWFAYKDVPNHLNKFGEKELHECFMGKRLMGQVDGKDQFFNKKNLKEHGASLGLVEQDIKTGLLELEQNLQQVYPLYHLSRLVLKDIFSLAVLNRIDKHLQELKQNTNQLPIGEFNKLISDRLRQQAAPFLYERLGEKYQHFFVDEFQDTSKLQWDNLTPLVNNALSGGTKPASALLVGDGKQSIYRWRGGEVEQFLSLSANKHPSNTLLTANKGILELYERKSITLGSNYRSLSEIVKFNSTFFTWISEKLDKDEYRDVYKQAHQKPEKGEGGYVHLEVNEHEKDFENKELQRIKLAIEEAQLHGYKRADIAILIRDHKKGKLIVDYLLSQQISVVSNATLVLQQSVELNFVINTLKSFYRADDIESRIKCLEFLWNTNEVLQQTNLFNFLTEFTQSSTTHYFNFLSTFWEGFSISEFEQMSLQEKCYTLLHFIKATKADAFISTFLDEVHGFQNKQEASVQDLLLWWTEKGSKKQLDMSGAEDAVRLMTIHKSKGLEFPVVIIPFADWQLSKPGQAIWMKLNPTDFFGLPTALVGLSSAGLDYTFNGYKEVYEHNKSAELLDNINLIYVAMTRAEEVLYVLSSSGKSSQFMSPFFEEYVREHGIEGKLILGKYPKKAGSNSKKSTTEMLDMDFKEENWTTRLSVSLNAPKDWEEGAKEALDFGKRIHQALSTIKTIKDYEKTEIDDELKNLVQNVLEHPTLKPLFSNQIEVLNERDILLPKGKMQRPDRVVIMDGKAHIVDYKTGNKYPEHKQQLLRYCQLLTEMGYQLGAAHLVYLGNQITIDTL